MSNGRPSSPSPFGKTPAPTPLSGVDVARVAIGSLIVFLFIAVFLGQMFGPIQAKRFTIHLYQIAEHAARAFAILAVIYADLIRRRGMSWEDIGFRVSSLIWMQRGLVFGIGFIPVAYLIGYATTTLLGRPPGLPPVSLSLPSAITLFLYVGILVPLAEEALFRGILFSWLRTRFPFYAAAAISAGIFSVAHFSEHALLPIFIAGMMLAYLTERSGSIWPAIIMHQTYNSLILIVGYWATVLKATP